MCVCTRPLTLITGHRGTGVLMEGVFHKTTKHTIQDSTGAKVNLNFDTLPSRVLLQTHRCAGMIFRGHKVHNLNLGFGMT